MMTMMVVTTSVLTRLFARAPGGAQQQVQHPETKKVSEVAKAGALKWGALTPAEKVPYEQQAAIKKVRAHTHKHTSLSVRVDTLLSPVQNDTASSPLCCCRC